LVDILSPRFAFLLEPGEGYTGGKTFFIKRKNELIETIPSTDLPENGEPVEHLPDSLVEALRVYFIGLAYSLRKGREKHPSMLVHPSRAKGDHNRFYDWVRSIQDRWLKAVTLPSSNPDYQDLREEMEAAINKLRRTLVDLPSFEELKSDVRLGLQRAVVDKVNSETGSEVNWSEGLGHILVGGQKLNRGYTVEGLTVTYMPRGPGTWTADTIQQLARFFGYKESYIGLCRVYLHPDVKRAFEDYVTHEEDIREQLRQFEGRPLTEWMRAFFLSREMQPTRRQVLSAPLFRELKDTETWLAVTSPHLHRLFGENRVQYHALMEKLQGKLQPHPLALGRHHHAVIPLKEFFEGFLLNFKVAGDHDTKSIWSARLWIGAVLDKNPSELVSIIPMGQGVRSLDNDKIKQLFQGHDAKQKYPGGRAIVTEGMVTVQLYEIDLLRGKNTIASKAPTVALNIPKAMRESDVMVQGNQK
jgi:hypothetical protein